MKNVTQKIIELTRVLEKNGSTMTLKQALTIENAIRDLKKQRDSESRLAYEMLLGSK